MPAAALAATVGLGVLLGRPLFAALTGQRAETRAAQRDARRAKLAADKARALAKKERRANSSLRAALDLARKQEAKSDAAATPATKPKEPTLHEVPPTPPEPDKPKAKTLEALGTEQPTKRDWAERLYAYVLREIREGRSANLGHKDHPNSNVLAAQKGMGGKLKLDGIYGDKTRARGKELLGKPFPARETARQAAKKKPAPVTTTPAPVHTSVVSSPPIPTGPRPGTPAKPKPKAKPAPVPARRSAVQAAEELLVHARELIGKGQGARLGTKGAPSAVVTAAQRDMGFTGDDVDGIYGGDVRRRGKELTGKTFPARL